MTTAVDNLGTFGIWTGSYQWPDDPAEVADAAAELEALGFNNVWIGLSTGDLALHEAILAATSRLVVATGIVNVWTEDPATVAANRQRLADTYPGRFLLGIGAGHAATVEPTGQTYTRPLSKVAAYLDALDTATQPVPVGDRVVAALGPKAIALAGERSAGAHPYLVPPEHTVDARAILGPVPLLVTEQKVVFETDPGAARAIARTTLDFYLQLPNYTNNLRRYGFDDADLAGTGSDRLIDALVGWGDDHAVATRLQAHVDAGANHVVVQVLTDDPGSLPRPGWRQAAETLLA